MSEPIATQRLVLVMKDGSGNDVQVAPRRLDDMFPRAIHSEGLAMAIEFISALGPCEVRTEDGRVVMSIDPELAAQIQWNEKHQNVGKLFNLYASDPWYPWFSERNNPAVGRRKYEPVEPRTQPAPNVFDAMQHMDPSYRPTTTPPASEELPA